MLALFTLENCVVQRTDLAFLCNEFLLQQIILSGCTPVCLWDLCFVNDNAGQNVGRSFGLPCNNAKMQYSSRSQEAQIDSSPSLNSQVFFVCL